MADYMKISAILAVGRDNEIGLNGGLPWVSKEDWGHFKCTTKGHCVLMGLTTYNTLGSPLKDRTNIVVSFDAVKIDGCVNFTSVEDGIEFARKSGEDELFIIGGASIYKYCDERGLLDRVYISTMLY